MIEKLFDGVFKIDGKLATVNLVKGKSVYGEELVKDKGIEYRTWNPYRSKLSAAILKGLSEMRIKRGSNVLYIGAATGTTPSHVSDIVGGSGTVYCIEISERNMRELLRLCETRHNMLPILQDARYVERYADEVGKADVIYQDVSARDQNEILVRNSALLKKGGYAYVAIKSQSIDITKNPKQVYKEFLDSVSSDLELVETIDIMPFDKKHLFAILEKA